MDRIKILLVQIFEAVKTVSLYWYFFFVPLFAIAVITQKSCGTNNEYERILEALNKAFTGINVDISRESAIYTQPNDLKRYIPNER